jgi:hypothetical protein
MVSTLIFSPRMLCRSASPMAPMATCPTWAPAPTTMIRLPQTWYMVGSRWSDSTTSISRNDRSSPCGSSTPSSSQ